MRHIVSFSGGKDSTATLLLMQELGIRIDNIIFADTGLEFPETYEFIDKVERHIGQPITRLKHPSKDFETLFYWRKKKGKRVGQMYGFPLTKSCIIQSTLKMIPIRRFLKTVEPYKSFLGIAYDEPKRYRRLKENERSLLYEKEMTQADSLTLCRQYGLVNPLYKYFDRLGCWLCPQQGIKGFRKLRKHFPDLWQRLLKYGREAEAAAKERRLAMIRPGWTVAELDARFELEDRQLCLFSPEPLEVVP